MDKGMWAIAAALSVALGILAAPASAAPVIGTGADGMKAALAEASPVENARWVRRCWRDRWGDRHCRRAWFGPSYGPGVGLYFGGRRHHFRGHHGFRGGHSFRGGHHGFRGRGSGGRHR